MLLFVGIKIINKNLLDVSVLEKHLNTLNLSRINVNALFEFGSLFLQLNDFLSESSMLDGLFQEVVVGNEDSELWLSDLVCPLLDLI